MPPRRPAEARPESAPAAPTGPQSATTTEGQPPVPTTAQASTPIGGKRRQTLLAHIAEWQRDLTEFEERGGHDRDRLALRGKLHNARDELHRYDIAATLAAESDVERRLLIQMREAVAAGSHVAAGAAERQLQEVRAARLAREQAEAEAAAARVDPAAAVARVVEQLQSFPDFLRRQIADALGATVHVHSDPPVLAIVPPPDDDGGSHHAQPSGRGLYQGRPRRVIGAP